MNQRYHHRHQETINVDSIIDKCVARDMDADDTCAILEVVFANTHFTTDFVCNRQNVVNDYKVQLDKLRALPVLEQRTPAWYEARKSIITASDFAQALGDGKFGTQKQIFQKKCGYEVESFNASSPPLKWGNMFESVANDIYCMRNNMKVYEFGLLLHPTIKHFGASPDGVNECGIMVEIKCPFKRKIDGQVPNQYFYQIQGQLDVCGLDECDYFECEFTESHDVDDVLNVGFERGAIVELESDMTYVYSPVSLDWSKAALVEWAERNGGLERGKVVHYYSLTLCNTVRVYKDPDFLNEKLDLLKEVWDKIKQYRDDKDLYDKEIKKPEASKAKAGFGFKLQGYAF
jgi:putative phage-type endonuclease